MDADYSAPCHKRERVVTTHRTYTCNLCRSRVVHKAEGRGDLEGSGIIFGSSADCSGTRFVQVNEAENHVCGACIAFIRRQPT
jgi:hypothetical protein